MQVYRALASIFAVLLAALAVPAHAAPSAQAGPTLTRFLLVASTFTDVVVEVDGRSVLHQRANLLSDYIALPPRTGRSELAIYGVKPASGDQGRALLNRFAISGESIGERGILILRDNGATSYVPDDAGSTPAGKSVLRVIINGLHPARPELRFGTQRLATDLVSDLAASSVVEPGTQVLEVRAASGQVLYAQYLRAQPGYRYEIVVARADAPDAPDHVLVVPVSPHLAAHPTATRLFRETGHYLDGRLRQYWETSGGLPTFGFPLNDDHLERTFEGLFVTQVFERNRFEYHPEQPAPYDVLLGRLGLERLVQLGRDWRAEWTPRPISDGCEAMQAWEHQFAVCEPFRGYYRSHGLELDGRPGFTPAESLALLGLPLTQASMEANSSGDRVLTQWFERARLEYHPKNPAAFRVQLGRLGAEVYGLEPLTFDDEDRAFRRFSNPGSADWNEAWGGFGGHYWWTCVESNRGDFFNASSNRWARWDGLVPPGRYELEVFVPDVHTNSANVGYMVIHSEHDAAEARLAQKPYANQWVRLATLEAAGRAGLIISSNTGEPGGCATQLAADAIRFVPRPARQATRRAPYHGTPPGRELRPGQTAWPGSLHVGKRLDERGRR